MASSKDSGTHVLLKGSRRYQRAGSQLLGRAKKGEWCELTVKIRRKTPLPEPVAGKPISKADLTVKYGADPKDLDKAKTVLSTYGLTVSANPAARALTVKGPVSAIETAFGVQLLRVKNNDLEYRDRVGDVYVPAALDGIITGVFGLDTRPMIKRRKRLGPRATRGAEGTIPPPDQRTWYLPLELADAYQFPPGDGSGQTIGILEFGGHFIAKDLKSFLALAGQPTVAPSVTVKNIHKLPLQDQNDTDAIGEVMLDIEIVASVCPKASIVVYFSEFTQKGWVDNLDAVLADAPSVLSVSYGLAEGTEIWTQNTIDAVNDALKELANAGITVCVSSGDDGSDDQVPDDGRAHLDFPASSPFVLAVGGTALSRATGDEVVWFDGDGLRQDKGGSTGGGVSEFNLRPSWQDVDIPSVHPHSIKGRIVPDVAANAAGSTGYLVVAPDPDDPSTSTGLISGGTSAATPLWASLIARLLQAGKTFGFLPPLLYKAGPGTDGKPVGAVACKDITSGENTTGNAAGYSALVGFDAVTGWGSPIGTELLDKLP